MKKPIKKTKKIPLPKDLLDNYDKITNLLLKARELAEGKISECGYKHIIYAINEIQRDYEFLADLVYRKKNEKKK